MLHSGQIEQLSRLGMALWPDPVQKARATSQALDAIALMRGSDEALMGAAAQALLKRALNESVRQSARFESKTLEQPFYYLSAIERFALVAVSQGYSYLDLARLLEVGPDEVGPLLWTARVDLGSRLGIAHPVGGGKGPHCPEYLLENPWTQKFFDEELSVRERLFLQNHLMACADCQKAVHAARILYHSVEKVLPTLDSNEKSAALRLLEAFQFTRGERFPELRSFGESVAAFIAKNRELQWMLSAFFLYLLISALKR